MQLRSHQSRGNITVMVTQKKTKPSTKKKNATKKCDLKKDSEKHKLIPLQLYYRITPVGP